MSQKGQVGEAITHFKAALAIRPDLAIIHQNLGNALQQSGQLGEAVTCLRRALELRPDSAAAWFDLGNALLESGQAEEAIGCFQSVLQIDPQFALAHGNLGNAFLRQGWFDEALAHYQAAIDARPTNSYFLNNLAWMLATCPQASSRNGARAVELAQQAEQLSSGKDGLILGTLAAAYAEAGQFPDAVAAAQRALALAVAQTNSAQAEILRSHIRLYRSGLSYHEAGRTNGPPVSVPQ